ncbi:GyrI-like domain-containing protein [Nocardia huaxiensis]|uniref:GyrI-like domain-containing protein n=1 Tax=Nocardia huaxiensis TaxID=2755382 RepID=A0A7D6VF09_9NOCA|nr:GyrI-like domain-containing protein [Nocardia huaxiensis]QLY32922.1 GyrI-like domain-containing protein [Nocardia huaxiensis]UFS93317.1 GyrI-like domain-containing protein [Nocardia huaxiensis]
MDTLDFKKAYRDLYAARREPVLLTVPPLPYLMIDGIGDPDGAEYKATVGALYAVAYGIRGLLKSAGTVVYSVPPLQGQWDGGPTADRSTWTYTMMIQQPPQADSALVQEAFAVTRKKKPDAPIDRVRWEIFDEGESGQILHVGPYATEPPTRDRLMEFLAAQGKKLRGRHHEIYLSAPGRVAPEAMKTLIRYPVTAI